MTACYVQVNPTMFSIIGLDGLDKLISSYSLLKRLQVVLFCLKM